MGGAGHWPARVGDPPTGTGAAAPTNGPSLLAGMPFPFSPGESPDGTGQWPVLPSQRGLPAVGPRDKLSATQLMKFLQLALLLCLGLFAADSFGAIRITEFLAE